jgi:hypothetical protein
MKALFSLLILSLSISSFGQEIFQLKKSKNKLNVLHFMAKVENCKFKTPAISNHWIMGEEKGQREALSSSEKDYFQPKVTYNNGSEVEFTMGALNKMGSKLPSKKILVRLESCMPKAFIEYDGEEVELQEIFANVNFMYMPESFILRGKTATGDKFNQTIK